MMVIPATAAKRHNDTSCQRRREQNSGNCRDGCTEELFHYSSFVVYDALTVSFDLPDE
jgi:hypothetical protein